MGKPTRRKKRRAFRLSISTFAGFEIGSVSWGGGGGGRGGRGGCSHTLPIRVCAAQRGRDFEAPDLERAIHFRGVFFAFKNTVPH